MLRSFFLSAWRLWLFWLLFFAVFRAWFVAWFPEEWPAHDYYSPWQALYHALPLDLSMAGYLMLIPVLLWFVGLAAGTKIQPFVIKLIDGYHIVLFIGLVVVFAGNIFLYKEWNTILNNRAVSYMVTSPDALLASLSIPLMVLYCALYLLLVWGIWKIYRRRVSVEWYPEKPSRAGLLALPLHLALLLWCIRGGAGVMGINESAVYYSPHLFNNHAATNTLWHLIHSVMETRSAKHNYHYMPEAEAQRLTSQLLPTDTVPPARPDSLPPNVVFIIMESMTAQVIESLGGEPGLCPTFNRLVQSGLLYENCYSSGFRTDQGLVSVLGGYPAQPDQSIVLQIEKAEQLYSLPKVLRPRGYATLFCYGGELTFANIGVWLRGQGFEHLLSIEDFSQTERTQRWGVDDRNMLQRFGRELDGLKRPFFATALTLSLHPPFDVPFESAWNGPEEGQKFKHCAAFVDDALRTFIEQVSTSDWYDNTLFVLVADHGAYWPGKIDLNEPGSRHIPLLLFGNPLPDSLRGVRLATYCNHHDIPATVLRLLKQPAEGYFPWSRALYPAAPTSFAYYTNENGLGWLTPKGSGFWSFQNSKWIQSRNPLDTGEMNQAKAFLQILYKDFLNK